MTCRNDWNESHRPKIDQNVAVNPTKSSHCRTDNVIGKCRVGDKAFPCRLVNLLDSMTSTVDRGSGIREEEERKKTARGNEYEEQRQ